jgi:hypothetical protein
MCQQRRPGEMRAHRPRNRMHVHVRQGGEVGRDAMADEVHFVTAHRQIPRLRVVGAIHPAERREIARRHEPPAHAPSVPCEAATP